MVGAIVTVIPSMILIYANIETDGTTKGRRARVSVAYRIAFIVIIVFLILATIGALLLIFIDTNYSGSVGSVSSDDLACCVFWPSSDRCQNSSDCVVAPLSGGEVVRNAGDLRTNSIYKNHLYYLIGFWLFLLITREIAHDAYYLSDYGSQ